MKRAILRPQARADRRDQVRYYRDEAGTEVAARLVSELRAPSAASLSPPAL